MRLDSAEYDVMLLDLMMPKLSGEKVITALKERSSRPLLIVMTADVNVEPEIVRPGTRSRSREKTL